MKSLISTLFAALRRLACRVFGMILSEAAEFATKHLDVAVSVLGSSAVAGTLSGRWTFWQDVASLAFVAGLMGCRRFTRHARG